MFITIIERKANHDGNSNKDRHQTTRGLLSLIWFDLFDLQSPQLVQHSCSARMIWDSNKVIIIIIITIIINGPYRYVRPQKVWSFSRFGHK